MDISEYTSLQSQQRLGLQDGLLKNKKKKKCHGNRRLQHFRRRCRARGMDNETIEMLVAIKKQNTSVHQNDNQKVNNEAIAHPSITKNIHNEGGIITVLNQEPTSLADTYPSMMKENWSTASTILPFASLLQLVPTEHQWILIPAAGTDTKKTKHSRLSIDYLKRSSSKLVPKYSKLPNYLFKHMLSKNIPGDRKTIQQWLGNPKVLEFFQQAAEFMCVILQLKIEQDYWTHVLNLAMPAMAWLSTVVKDVKEKNCINWDYPRTVDNVFNRQKIIHNKLLKAQNDLNAHFRTQQHQLPDQFCTQMQNNTSNNHMMSILSDALAVLIQNDLGQLRTYFERKKILLKFDVNDVELVKSFYDLNPTKEQINLIQKIWRTKVRSSKRTINQMKNRSSSNIVEQNTNDFNNDHDDQQRQLLSSTEPSHYFMHPIVEARLENIEQRAQQILKFIKESSA